jgi:hypothetical protein
MFKKFVSLALVLTVAVVVAATAATARAGMTLSLGQPDLQAGVLIVLPVTVSCSPFDPALVMAGSNVFVSVEQAVTKTAIAHGFGGSPQWARTRFSTRVTTARTQSPSTYSRIAQVRHSKRGRPFSRPRPRRPPALLVAPAAFSTLFSRTQASPRCSG